YLMKITHAFRGEEWLPSAPVHIMLWKYFGWIDDMPQWAHLPLILKPDGKGKLSKRDGDRLGFPVFAMDWKDPATGEVTSGFREMGFLPDAFVNMLALLGWNDGSEQEIFTREELIANFSMDRVHKGGAKFNFEKAKWFNHEWIKRTPDEVIAEKLKDHGGNLTDDKLMKIASLVKERCTFLTDLWPNAYFFFNTPEEVDVDSIRPKWTSDKRTFFSEWSEGLNNLTNWSSAELETSFKELAASKNIKPGDVQLPLRIMLVGKKVGPGVFDIAEIIGKEETIKRISLTLARL
ncbi:MAG: glutamate--tRNA ligase, partial [Proteobacteria bacterium]